MTLNLYIWLHNLCETNIKLCCLYVYFLTLIIRVLKVVLVFIDLENVLDLRHLLHDCHNFAKRGFTFGRDQQARIVDKNFLKVGGATYETFMKSWRAKKKNPDLFQKIFKILIRWGRGVEREKVGWGPNPPPLIQFNYFAIILTSESL